MLNGVFHKAVAYLGIAIAPIAIIAMMLYPIVGVAYFWWWLPLLVWLAAAGWTLFRLGGQDAVSAYGPSSELAQNSA